MTDDLVIGPFGRLLPQPIPSRSASNYSHTSPNIYRSDRPGGTDVAAAGVADQSLETQPFSVHLPPFRNILSSNEGGVAGWSHATPSGNSIGEGTTMNSNQRTYSPSVELTAADLGRANVQPQPWTANVDSRIPGHPGHRLTKKVMGEEMIPGKGVCYIYEDGTYCPKTIDGDSVNPNWGITKAGKPRKRLAQACTTCREKKIKCDPGSPKCLQCQKSGRECKFEPFARTYRRSMSPSSTANSPTNMDNTSPAPHRDSSASNEPSAYSSSRPLSSSKSSIALEHLLSTPALEKLNGDISMADPPNKRIRHSVPSPSVVTEAPSDPSSRRKLVARSPAMQLRGSVLQLDVDPYTLDRELAEYYLSQYFDNINANNFYIFPRRLFMDWVRHNDRKSLWEKMLLYAMLAFGTVFSTNREHEAHGKMFAKVAHKAESAIRGKFLLPVLHTRLILAHYNCSRGNIAKSWDYSGAAVRCASGMKLNLEDGIASSTSAERGNYDLPPKVLIECKRRTLWTVMLLDRFLAFTNHLNPCQILPHSLHLPCDELMFENDTIPETPLFGLEAIDSQPRPGGGDGEVGLLGQLILILSIWGEIISSPSKLAQESFYHKMNQRLDTWEHQLPSNLQLTPKNIAFAQSRGCLGAYGLIHVLKYCAVMRLNRHIPSSVLSTSRLTQCIRRAHEAAVECLELTKAMAFQRLTEGKNIPVSTISNPSSGYAIICAVDILTAAGTINDLVDGESKTMSLVTASIAILEQMLPHWKTIDRHLRAVTGRYRDILALTSSIHFGRKAGFYARTPLETLYSLEKDLVYSIPRKQYLTALGKGDRIRNEDDLLDIAQPDVGHGSREPTEPLSTADRSTWYDDGDDDDDDGDDGDDDDDANDDEEDGDHREADNAAN